MNVAVVRRHWCIEVQAEGFQEQDEVSEIFVNGETQLFNGLTGFVWEIEGTIPVRYMNQGAAVHQMVRDNDLRGGVMEERINGEEDDDQGEAMGRAAPLKEMISSKEGGRRNDPLV